MTPLKNHLTSLLRLSERYTRTDMVYLVQSGFWVNSGTVVISILSLVLYIVFANTLPKDVYGTYQFLISAAAIVGAFTLTGMNSAVARAVAQGYEGALREAVRTQLRWGFIPAFGSLVMSLYYFLNENTLLASGFIVIAFLIPLSASFNLYASYLNGKKDFRRGFFYGMGWNVPYYAVLIVISFLSPTALLLIAAGLATQTLALYIAYRRTLHAYKPTTNTDPAMVPYGRHLSVMNLLSAIATQLDTVFAFYFLGPIDLARYSFATAIPERLGVFFKFIQSAALPKLSKKAPSKIQEAFGPRIWWAVLATGLIAGLYALIAPFIFSLLFPAYTEVIPYTQIYSLTVITSLAGLFTTGLTAERNIRDLYIFNIISPIAQLILQLGGILFYGLWGLIIGRLLSNFMSFLLAVTLMIRSR